MADVTVQWDYSGMGHWLVGPEAQALCTAFAEAGVPFAKAISPDALPKGTGYLDRFEVDGGHIENVTVRPGRRAVAYLANTSDYAAAVEYGWDEAHKQFGNHAGYHVLARTADYIESL